MVFSSFLFACAANINIKTTVCTIFSLPATKIQYPATAAGNRVTERPQADRQNPDGRLRRRRAGPVVHRSSTGPENAAGRKATGRGSQNRPRTTERAKPAHNLTRRTRDPGGAGRETRAERDKKPGRSGTRNPGGVERETRAEWNERPGRSGTRDPGGHKKTDRNLQIAVRRFGSGSLTSRFSYRSALRNGS